MARADKKPTGKKSLRKKAMGKKALRKNPAYKKSTGKKSTGKKSTGKKSSPSTIALKETMHRKTTGKKHTDKKNTDKTIADRKNTSKKPTSKKAIPRATSALSDQECKKFFAALAAERPEPQGELHYTNSYTLLVAVVLSAQATDSGVNRATVNLFPLADTPQKMLALGEAKLRTKIQTIGLYRTKAKNVIALSRQLVSHHQGQVPQDHDSLVALPGVGRKTANVVRNIAFAAETIAVDTHVFRVANRTGLAAGKNTDEVEAALLRRVPRVYLRHAHHWLILHGRYTCTARAPKCGACPVFAFCRWQDKER